MQGGWDATSFRMLREHFRQRLAPDTMSKQLLASINKKRKRKRKRKRKKEKVCF